MSPIRLSPRDAARTAVAVLALALGACMPERPPPPENGVSVYTLRAERVAVDATLRGRVQAQEVSELRPQVGGIVRRRMFEQGGVVKAGQPMVEIERGPYLAAHAAAEAQLAQAQAALAAATPRAARYRELVAMDAVSRQDADDVIAAEGEAAAAVLAARAQLQAAAIDLDNTLVRAPIDGHVGAATVSVGALVSPGQAQALATIHRLDPVYVDLSQSGDALMATRRRIAAGELQAVDGADAVDVLLDDGRVHPHKGRLEVVGVAVDEGTGTVAVRAAVPNPDTTLMPGMYVRARVAMGVDPDGILVPQQAVSRDPRGEPFALVVDAAGKVSRRALSLGEAVGDQWRVLEGLAAGDRVVMETAGKAQPGATVKTVDWQPGKPMAALPPRVVANGKAAQAAREGESGRSKDAAAGGGASDGPGDATGNGDSR